VPTFLLHIRLDLGPLPYIVSAAIVDPDTTGFRGLIRRFADAKSLRAALAGVGIDASRSQGIVDNAATNAPNYFEVSLVEAQKLDVIQIDTTE
jgi:hypothetical protein